MGSDKDIKIIVDEWNKLSSMINNYYIMIMERIRNIHITTYNDEPTMTKHRIIVYDRDLGLSLPINVMTWNINRIIWMFSIWGGDCLYNVDITGYGTIDFNTSITFDNLGRILETHPIEIAWNYINNIGASILKVITVVNGDKLISIIEAKCRRIGNGS